ncbi:hypothetical protein PF008_g32016 [Phytophthora fragariae]|uniref:Uncharacterized protein n=1 Tax=Phytophthora fragariae TaxID=53985 RepID=A0A6G0Q0Z5_9STRA|nr:hypothetical protein PF008_g32016 [Phytophthora fragariae]
MIFISALLVCICCSNCGVYGFKRQVDAKQSMNHELSCEAVNLDRCVLVNAWVA